MKSYYYPGVDGLSGDGDIYRFDNQKVFREFVWQSTNGAGLHFVMADGVCMVCHQCSIVH